MIGFGIERSMRDPGVTYSECLPTGIMVHFSDDRSVFFPSRFFVDHRDEQPPLRETTDENDGPPTL